MSVFELPEVIKTNKDQIRHVGFELEYSGLDLKSSVALLETLIGNDAVADGAFYYSIEDKDRGPFSVEVDAALLRDGKYREYLSSLGVNIEGMSFEKKLDEILTDIAGTIVPTEIVTPPLAMNDMEIVEEIVIQLREQKAEGTSASILYAFGLHMNPELVSQDADYLLNHIRAFAILYDWISHESEVDLMRKLTPYIDPYPKKYLKHILSKDYKPDIETLINDYMDFIGTRNQALDMLPAFADIDKPRVMKKANEPDLIKPRPAFHYRLANCLIDKPGWSINDEWMYWLRVEALANDKALQEKLANDYLQHLNQSVFASKSEWIEHITSYIG